MNQTQDEQHIFEILQARGLLKSQFEAFFMTRSQWATYLQCSRTSLWNYEQKIIRLVFPILKEYDKTDFLDGYQRFILAVIYSQSQGWIDGKRRNHAEIKAWLKRSHKFLTRQQFENWIGTTDDFYPQ